MIAKARGFTLVEILLVLVLGALLVGLVAPLGVRQVEKARAQSEWLTLQREVRSLALRAVARNEYLSLRAAGHELAWCANGGDGGAMTFEQLYFEPEQFVTFNPNGIADAEFIELLQRDRRRRLNILPAESG